VRDRVHSQRFRALTQTTIEGREMAEYKLFKTGTSGPLILVEVIGLNPHSMNGGLYIRYLNDKGTDTVTPKWLYDIPEGLKLESFLGGG